MLERTERTQRADCADLDDVPSADRWMVSWADFTTLLFALFVVLYASSTVNKNKTQQVSHSLGQAFGSAQPVAKQLPQQTPVKAALNSEQHQAQKMTAIANDIRRALGALIAGGKVSVTQNARGIGIDINASLLFATGEAQLSATSVQVTAAVADVLARYPYAIQIEGHTDSTPIHNAQFASNWELSSVRASSVVRRLVQSGVAEDRLAVIGHGANQPLDENGSAEGRARNRRVHVLIVVGGVEE